MSIDVLEARIRRKIDGFREIGLWPKEDRLNLDGWLDNFQKRDLEYALYLLDGFMYYNKELVEQMFISCIHNLSSCIVDAFPNDESGSEWDRFMDQVIVTYVTGENPNPTDSGYLFARYARQLGGISEDRILDPENAVHRLRANPDSPLIIVDDFIGSGDQFENTWRRPYQDQLGEYYSLERVCNEQQHVRVYCCPLVATDHGCQVVAQLSRNIILNPVHVLSSRHSPISSNSTVWPTEKRTEAMSRIEEICLGLNMANDGSVNDWRGYQRLGMAVSFEHGTPDATMPIFYWEQRWTPLIMRR